MCIKENENISSEKFFAQPFKSLHTFWLLVAKAGCAEIWAEHMNAWRFSSVLRIMCQGRRGPQVDQNAALNLILV